MSEKKPTHLRNIDEENIEFMSSDDEMQTVSDNGMEETDICYDDSPPNAADTKKKPYFLLPRELASWTCTSGSGNSLSSLSDLCKTLRPYGFENLPKDSRTLLQTPKESHALIRDVSPGQYIHIGLQIGIEYELKKNCVDVSQVTEIVIDCDMDGVRICKSSNGSFWPIWCILRKPLIGDPFLVGNYAGNGAPKDANLYVYDFVEEFKKLMSNGLRVGNKTISVQFGRFIGDSPGRCDIFGLKGLTGYYGCPRCVTKGSRHNNRICFPELTAALRTNEDFKNRFQPEHHKFTSLLESELKVNCISQVPLDSMHLLYACITNRILFWLNTDEVNFMFQLSTAQIVMVNQKLAIAALSQPREFARSVVDIRQYKQFKCTQNRLFLLYLSIVVLKDVFTKNQYEHLLLLVLGVRILSDEKHFKSNNSVAKCMLAEYVRILESHFGIFRCICSFHMLIHLADETLIQDEPLDRFAMWKFETANIGLKQFSRRQGAYLQQSYNRTIERYKNTPKVVPGSLEYPKLTFEIKRSFGGAVNQSKKTFNRIEFEKFMLDTSYGNCWFLSTSGSIVKFEHAVKSEDTQGVRIKILGRFIVNKANFFENPISSSLLHIHICSDRKLSQPVEVAISDVDSKMFMIQYGEKMVFLPLLK